MAKSKKNKIKFKGEVKEVKMSKNKDNDKEYSCKFTAFSRALMELEKVPEDEQINFTVEW